MVWKKIYVYERPDGQPIELREWPVGTNYNEDDDWKQKHREQFGTEPDFF